MKIKKLLLVAFIFMVSYFVVSFLFDVVLWGKEFGSIDIWRTLFTSLFFGIGMGLLMKFKLIKTTNILSK